MQVANVIVHIYACVWLYVNYHVVMSSCFVCDAIFLEANLFVLQVFSHLCLFPHIHFSSNIVPGICWHLWVLISTLLLLLLCHEKKLEMHMRNKQYRTCRSQKSQRLVIFLRRCMSGYVKGYDVGLKQVFGFNVS